MVMAGWSKSARFKRRRSIRIRAKCGSDVGYVRLFAEGLSPCRRAISTGARHSRQGKCLLDSTKGRGASHLAVQTQFRLLSVVRWKAVAGHRYEWDYKAEGPVTWRHLQPAQTETQLKHVWGDRATSTRIPANK